MSEKKQSRGGKRKNSGRKALHPQAKRQTASITLPPWLLRWMDKRPESRAKLIEKAMKNTFELSDPSIYNYKEKP